MVAINWSVPKEVDLFDPSPGYGGDEVPRNDRVSGPRPLTPAIVGERAVVMSALTIAERHEYTEGIALAGGEARFWFRELAGACLARFLAKNGQASRSSPALDVIVLRVWGQVDTAGWPAPLQPGERRLPQERSIPELEAWVGAAVEGPERTDAPSREHEFLFSGIRQLFKACLYPEISSCRESFRQVDPSGLCKRQNLASARARICGSPCIDCPYTVTLTSQEHENLLQASWVPTNSTRYIVDALCFLPEDFRRLRRFLWLHARSR